MATIIKMILILNLLWSEFVETMSEVSICFYRSRLSVMCSNLSNGVFGTTGQVVPTSGQVVETTCKCSVVSTTDFYQLSGSVQLQI